MSALLASAFSARYLAHLPDDLRTACLCMLGIPPETPVEDVVCIPPEAITEGLRQVMFGEPAVSISAMQVGMFNKGFRQACADVDALRPLSTPSREPARGPQRDGPMIVQMAAEDPMAERFSRILNQSATGTFLPMTSEELRAARQMFKDVLGNVAREEERPSSV